MHLEGKHLKFLNHLITYITSHYQFAMNLHGNAKNKEYIIIIIIFYIFYLSDQSQYEGVTLKWQSLVKPQHFLGAVLFPHQHPLDQAAPPQNNPALPLVQDK